MNALGEFILKGCRKIYQKIFRPKSVCFNCECDPDRVSDVIYNFLISDEPCMIARFGSTELNAISNYQAVIDGEHDVFGFIKGRCRQWWWNELAVKLMESLSGFFPANKETIARFYEMMMKDIPLVNILGSWRPEEVYFKDLLEIAIKVNLICLEPYWSKDPWSRALEGKHVLVVHPFADDIISQYNNHRAQLFEDKRVLPKFASLRVLKAVQSLGGEDNGFKDWFEALDWMKDEMDKAPYDIALIGCGAYGFPLAAHAKRTGHKAVHLGGALQLLFGIRGKRWDNPNYGVKEWGIPIGLYSNMMNDYWIRPNEKGRPQNAQQVENGCYW